MSNSTRLRSDMYDRLCNNDRRGFLKGAAGVLGGTAVTTLLKTQSQPSAGASADMFDGFKISKVQTTGATINVISNGQGPPVPLLHGNPQTHVMWHKIAPRLATEFTVVAAYLRGYGDSSKPADGENHSNYSKRNMALDQIEVMHHFGFEKFAVVGHDRGGRVGHRMALDHPDRITKLAVLDIVPTYTLLHGVNSEVATAFYHWFFLVQPAPFPETLIAKRCRVLPQVHDVPGYVAQGDTHLDGRKRFRRVSTLLSRRGYDSRELWGLPRGRFHRYGTRRRRSKAQNPLPRACSLGRARSCAPDV
jgi:pimeloyl-ACP methyl ester carboxylesterase